jgi:hypothetical protein
MEPHRRAELVDTLLAEATQKLDVLERASAVHGISHAESHGSVQGMPRSAEQYNIQEERDCWEKVCKGLTEVRNAFEQIERAERQRGVIARGARG